jgi:beta-xylosidase
VGRDRVARLLLALALAVAGCGTDGGGGGAGPAGSPATTAAGPRQFTNPVLAGNFADPAVLKVGDTWYAYATGDLVVNLQVARSTDLVRWERLDDALPELLEWSVLQKGLTWAPEAAKTPAGLVLHYTLRDEASGRQCISVSVGKRADGPFRDIRSRPLVCQERLGGSIDPHRFVDRDDAAWEGDLIEAPTLWRDGDTYYLFYSANDYGSPSYAVGYATASRVLGPYRDGPGNPILPSRGSAAGPGGQAVVTDGPQEAP